MPLVVRFLEREVSGSLLPWTDHYLRRIFFVLENQMEVSPLFQPVEPLRITTVGPMVLKEVQLSTTFLLDNIFSPLQMQMIVSLSVIPLRAISPIVLRYRQKSQMLPLARCRQMGL